MSDEPVKLNGLIDRLMSSLGLSRQYKGWQVVSQWPEIVGEEIASVTRAHRFCDGVLTVLVEKDVWRQELEMQQDEILKKIRARSGGRVVEKIVLRAGSTKEQKPNGSENETGS